jgi:hypothetical protein
MHPPQDPRGAAQRRWPDFVVWRPVALGDVLGLNGRTRRGRRAAEVEEYVVVAWEDVPGPSSIARCQAGRRSLDVCAAARQGIVSRHARDAANMRGEWEESYAT